MRLLPTRESRVSIYHINLRARIFTVRKVDWTDLYLLPRIFLGDVSGNKTLTTCGEPCLPVPNISYHVLPSLRSLRARPTSRVKHRWKEGYDLEMIGNCHGSCDPRERGRILATEWRRMPFLVQWPVDVTKINRLCLPFEKTSFDYWWPCRPGMNRYSDHVLDVVSLKFVMVST